MEYFISFQKASNEIPYLFNKNHFLVLLLSLVIIIFFSMYISRQKLKIQKVSVLIIAILLTIIESLRIFWRYKFLEYNHEPLSFLNVTSLDFFTLSLWISIPLIFIGAIIKKKNKKNIFVLDFVFSVATLFGILTLIYPVNINTYFEFYHCSNIIYMLSRSLIIMLGFTFVFSKWISAKEFLDLWKAILSLVCFWIVCIVLNLIFQPNNNLFFLSYFPLFEDLGLHLTSPWNVVVLSLFIFVLQVILYLPFRIHEIRKSKRSY